MKHLITILLTSVFFICLNHSANAAMTHNNQLSLKKPLIKEDLTKSTKVIKKKQHKAVSKKAVKRQKVVLDMDKPVKKAKKNRTVASTGKKSLKKKYWSVQCREGFIKDSYVYCARQPATASTAKKPAMKKVAMKKAKAGIRK